MAISTTNNFGRQSCTEVSESAFEYLLGEILNMKPVYHDLNETLLTPSDVDFIFCQQLDEMGYNIGFRFVLMIR